MTSDSVSLVVALALFVGCDDNGLAPWDLNGNGACDIDTEDANGDGWCDSSDLDWDGGPDGDVDGDAEEPRCWDLNGNGRCDVDREDLDGDRACTVADCPQVSFEGTVEGIVVDAEGEGVSGAMVIFTPGDVSATTAENGTYRLDLTVGLYDVHAGSSGFLDSTTERISVVANVVTEAPPLRLLPENPISVDAGPDQRQVGYGATVTLTATVEGPGSFSYRWTQTEGPPVVISSANAPTTTVTLPTLEEILTGLRRELPRRTDIFAVSPRTQGLVVLELEVASDFFDATDAVTITAAEPTGSAPTVALGIRSHFGTAESSSYDWRLETPEGSSASMENASGRFASFVPDVSGTYLVTQVGGRSIELYAGEWVGVIGRVASCRGCHNDDYAPDMFSRWIGTKHATMFERAIDGRFGEEYGAECLSCHTVGYSEIVDNNGFDDVAGLSGWSLPDSLHEGNWENMAATSPEVARLANVQCESCHGPQDTTAHMTGIRGRFGTGMCARCHDSGSHSTKPYEWEFSTHADLRLSLENATIEEAGAEVGDCGRCHSAQGYVVYANALALGDNGPIPGDIEFFETLGLREETVEPITCSACHEPHGTTNPHQLRFHDSIDSLPAGFSVEGAGAGAICMTCHNSRFGRHGDEYPSADHRRISLPSQADVLWGRNAFFIGHAGPYGTSHVALDSTCTNCHMREAEAVENPAEGGHSWQIAEGLCSRCHGEGVTGGGIQGVVEENLEILEIDVGRAIVRALENEVSAGRQYAVRAWNPSNGCYSSESAATSNVLIASAPREARLDTIDGEIGVVMVLPSPVTFGWSSEGCTGSASTTTVNLQLSSLVRHPTGVQIIPPDDVIVSAVWNIDLIAGDGSGGIHNPSWVFLVLRNTMEAVWER